jgi:hypothetical protein
VIPGHQIYFLQIWKINPEATRKAVLDYLEYPSYWLFGVE